MFSKKSDSKVRSQEIFLFGASYEDPKTSFGGQSTGFTPIRKTRESVVTGNANLRNHTEDYVIIDINFDSGECEYQLIDELNGTK